MGDSGKVFDQKIDVENFVTLSVQETRNFELILLDVCEFVRYFCICLTFTCVFKEFIHFTIFIYIITIFMIFL